MKCEKLSCCIHGCPSHNLHNFIKIVKSCLKTSSYALSEDGRTLLHLHAPRVSEPVVELWCVEHLCLEHTTTQPIYHVGKANARTDCNDIRC